MSRTQTIYSRHEPWFRGNLHCHTTNSDGALPPEEVISLYASMGYNFLAITDHLVVTHPQQFQRDNLLLLPGVELHGDEKGPGRTYHMVVVGTNATAVAAEHRTSDQGQLVIERAHTAGCLVFVAHPYRLGMTTEEVLAFHKAHGIEIYNHVGALGGKALSVVYWDAALDAGVSLWGFANDDAHFRRNDYGGGWLMVQAPTLDAQSIFEAMCAGRFYASTGPQFEELALIGREVRVRCSPARAVRFLSNRMTAGGAEAEDDLLTEATWTVPSKSRYVRVVVEDERGRSAWSQPMIIN